VTITFNNYTHRMPDIPDAITELRQLMLTIHRQ
jgi:hypothetical protein